MSYAPFSTMSRKRRARCCVTARSSPVSRPVNALIFSGDAGTLFACLRALGTDASFETSFIALIMASIVVTLGPIPLGLGSFEATSTATLRLLGISFEAAFAGRCSCGFSSLGYR